MEETVLTTDINSLPPLLIRASAGTGKTYQLSGRLLRILLGGAAPESVIATTFTRKAAGEILNRVLLSLARAATDESELALKALAAQTGVNDLTREQCVKLAHALLRDIHRLRILTLDSLFSQLARSFSYEIGVPPGWRLADEIEDVGLSEMAIDSLLSEISHNELLSLLAQLSKGDNKRSVRNELLSVINDGYHVSRGCHVNAWDSIPVPYAPPELAIRNSVEALSQATVGHKSADGYLRRIADWVELRLWEEIGKIDLVCNMPLLSPHDEVSYYKKILPPEIITALRVVADRLKTHLLGLLPQTQATGQVIAAYQSHIDIIKQSARVFSFDDIAFRLARSLFTQDIAPVPNDLARTDEMSSDVKLSQIAIRMDGSIDHLLLDEFQDTSPMQWSVLKPLARNTARADSTRSFFCVGDTKQAIYGWRGGVAEIFDQVCAQISGIVQHEQNTSFRSSPIIIDAVNLIFKNLHCHPIVTEQSANPRSDDSNEAMRRALTAFETHFPNHDSSQPELPGYVIIRSSNIDPKAKTSQKFPHLKFVADRVTEAAKTSPQHSIGVLTRTNESVAWLIQMLRAAGVDVSQEGGNPLVDSPAVAINFVRTHDARTSRRWPLGISCGK